MRRERYGLLNIDADELRRLLQEAGLEGEAGIDEAANANQGAWSEAHEPPADEQSQPQPETTVVKRTQSGGGDEAPPTSAAIYFRDISAVELLTAEEEVDLAQQ